MSELETETLTPSAIVEDLGIRVALTSRIEVVRRAAEARVYAAIASSRGDVQTIARELAISYRTARRILCDVPGARRAAALARADRVGA